MQSYIRLNSGRRKKVNIEKFFILYREKFFVYRVYPDEDYFGVTEFKTGLGVPVHGISVGATEKEAIKFLKKKGKKLMIQAIKKGTQIIYSRWGDR